MGRLFWKFFFAFWLALLAVGVAVGVGVSVFHQQEPRDTEVATGGRATLMVNSAAVSLAQGGGEALRPLLTEWERLRPGRPPLFAVDAGGLDLFGRPVPAAALARARSLPGLPAGGDGDSGRPEDSPVVRTVRLADGQELLIFVPASPPGPRSPSHRDPPAPQPVVLVVIGLLASIAFSTWLARYVSLPVRHLRWGFAAVARGCLDARVQPRMGRRRDEIADLGGDFDRMVQELNKQIDAQRRLLHDVSHELRSPLARLHAAVGLARQDPRKLTTTLDRIERESQRLDQLVGELLTLSRVGVGSAQGTKLRLELLELLAAIADDARFEAQASGRELVFSCSGEFFVEAHAELLGRAFENVLRNAVKFTADGTSVTVGVWIAAERIEVRVCDRGPGVPEAELEAIFEPFHRCDNGKAAAGFGLGLAIARRAIEASGGTIGAGNREGGGLCVDIVLPGRAGGGA
jgi:two-component system OmpR family sensor kinase